jgi:ankyrin repeat protein
VPVDFISRKQRLELVEALLDYGADPNARRSAIGPLGYGQDPKKGVFDEFAMGVGTRRLATPLFMASDNERADPAIVRALVKAGADPTLTTDDKTTPLMVAAGLGVGTTPPRAEERARMLEVVAFLVEKAGVDVNVTNDAGFTALHGAAYTGSDAIVRYLVERGAKIDAQDFQHRTPYRIAQGHKAVTDFHEWPQTAELLAKLGANTSLGVDAHTAERERSEARGQAHPASHQP